MRSIYLIGSLRNEQVPLVGDALRSAGFDVFDNWYAAGPEADDYWQAYEKGRGHSYKEALASAEAQHVFAFDKTHLDRADIAVMLMPCGRSGHIELGYFLGTGKRGYILFDKEPERYDVMYNFATDVFFDVNDLIKGIVEDIPDF